MKTVQNIQAFFIGGLLASTLCLKIGPEHILWVAVAAAFALFLSIFIPIIYAKIKAQK